MTQPNGQCLRVGICGIGLDAYWPQFDGLKQRLEGYMALVASQIDKAGVEVVNLGLIDTPQRSQQAGRECRVHDIDLLVLYVTTYALSNTVLPLLQRAGVPVLVLNLQPQAAIDYASFNRMEDRTAMTGEWLAFCSACPLPEIANVMQRAGIPFHQVVGILGAPETRQEIHDWLAAASIRNALRNGRVGLMGHYYSGMLDIMTDLTLVSIVFGTHFEMVEVDELSALAAEVDLEQIALRVSDFQLEFDVLPECADEELARAARTSLALDRLVAKHQLDALAYYYKGSGIPANEETMETIILGTSRLTANHVPVAGEYEVKNVLAMKIMDTLGVGGSFTEFYAIDFNDDVVLMGHDGPGHTAIAEGMTKVRPLNVYHGKVGRGLSVEMSVKHGPVTLLSIVEDSHSRFKFLVAQGESIPGAILEIGNTNSRYHFSLGAREFVSSWTAAGPAHHCAVGVGHVASTLKKAAALLGVGFQQVC
jgi:L-arabinose isomerase